MSEKLAPKIILNLLEAPLKPVHETFFKSNGFVLKKNIYDLSADEKVTHILVDNHKEDWESINSMYDTLKKRINVISFAPVKNLKSFMNIGGRAVLERDYFDDKLGQIFVKRLFTEEVSLHMDEVFGANFIKYKSLKMNGHVRSGYYSDIIAAEGFEQDFNNIAIRGFIYNTAHFVSYLKESDIATLPFDLEYAQNAKYFAIQMVVQVKNFFLEYIINSFGATNTNDPIEYVLRDNLSLCHGFDITYLEKSSSIIITGLWSKSESKINPSFSFGNIKQVKQYFQKIKEDIELAPVNTNIEALEVKVELKKLPGKHLEKLDAIQEEEVVNSIKKLDADGGGKVLDSMTSSLLKELQEEDEQEDSITVKGGVSLKEDKTIVHGDNEQLDEETTLVKGHSEETHEGILVKGTKEELGKDNRLVKGTKEELGKDNTVIKGSKEELGKDNTIVKGQKEDFTEAKTVIKSSLKAELKSNLVAKIKNNPSLSEEEQKTVVKDTVAKFTTSEILKFNNSSPEEKEKGLDALASVIAESTGGTKEEAKAFIVKGSREAEEKSINVVKGDSQSFQEAVLLQKLKQKDEEIKQLTTKLDYYKTQLNAEAEHKKKMDVIHIQSAKIDDHEIQKVVENKKEFQRVISDEEIQKMIQQEGNSKVSAALRKLSERESELVDLAKASEIALKKKEIEFKAKEQQITREIEKADKQVKNRDLLLTKAKETTKVFMEKKEKEVRELSDKVKDLNSRLITQKGAPDPFVDQLKLENSDLKKNLEEMKKEVNSLRRESLANSTARDKDDGQKLKAELQRVINEKNAALSSTANLNKEAVILKEKLAEAEKNLNRLKSEIGIKAPSASAPAPKVEIVSDDPNKLKVENQRLSGERSNLLNEKKTLETQVGNLRGENSTLKAEVVELKKKLTEKIAPASTASTKSEPIVANMPAVAKDKPIKDDFSMTSNEGAQLEMTKIIKERDKKLSEQADQIKGLEAKLTEVSRERDNLMSGAETVAKTKMGQLENANKKLTADLQAANTQLAENKKEIAKAKSESMSFKNQLDKVKKDLEKVQKSGKKAA